MPMPLPAGLLELLNKPSLCFVATLMPDGSPQLSQTWVTTDGEHVVINIVDGMQKARNLARDGRVALNIADPDNPTSYFAVRGRVIDITTDGAKQSIDDISHKYLGIPYPYFSGNPDETRVLITIEADRISPAE
ncbi:MAG: PPOX class F420-dependent oxidoreductase [Mycobacterium sp.]